MRWKGRKRIEDRLRNIIVMTDGLRRWVTRGLGVWTVIRPWSDRQRSILW